MRVKHLEMIQGVINRLSHNSFLLKSWTVVLIAALFALSASESKPTFILFAYFPVFVLWGLDGYYLKEERKFRDLYNSVRRIDESEIDFSMECTSPGLEVVAWWKATFSKTLIPYYGVLLCR